MEIIYHDQPYRDERNETSTRVSPAGFEASGSCYIRAADIQSATREQGEKTMKIINFAVKKKNNNKNTFSYGTGELNSGGKIIFGQKRRNRDIFFVGKKYRKPSKLGK